MLKNLDGYRVWSGRFLRGSLVGVKSFIGSSEHAFGQIAGRIFLPTGRILDAKSPAFPSQFERAEAVQNKLQLLAIAFGKNQQEFIATHAHGEIAPANSAIKGRSKFLQHQITGGVAVRVVDVFELIKVQEHYRQGMALAGGARHFRDEALLGKSSVVEARQGVDHSEVAQDHGVMLLFRELSTEAFDKHLLIDSVDIEENDENHQSKNRFRNLDLEERSRSLS